MFGAAEVRKRRVLVGICENAFNYVKSSIYTRGRIEYLYTKASGKVSKHMRPYLGKSERCGSKCLLTVNLRILLVISFSVYT